MRLLVTGATGWIGGFLCRLAVGRRTDVHALVRPGVNPPPGIPFVHADLTDPASLRAAVREVRPDVVAHLAAAIPGAPDWTVSRGVAVNAVGTVHLLDAIREHAPSARTLIVSSSSVYGASGGEPIDESVPPAPASPYAMTKLMAELAGVHYAEAFGLHVVRVRTFNVTGPLEPARLIGGTIAAQIAAIERGTQPPTVHVRSLGSARDFTDVRDVVEACWAALTAGSAGEVYNVCSGHGHGIREVASHLVTASHVAPVTVIEDEPDRPESIPGQIGNPARLQRATGWQPTIAFADSLRDLLESYRAAGRRG